MGGPVAHDGTRRDAAGSRRGTSLATQVTTAGLTLGVVVALIFVLMARTVDAQRDAAKDAERTGRLVSAGNLLERYVIDAETGQRGFLLTGQEPFLEPLLRAKREIPPTTARVRALAGADPATLQRIDRIRAAIDEYVRSWVDAVVALGRTDLPAARRRVQTG